MTLNTKHRWMHLQRKRLDKDTDLQKAGRDYCGDASGECFCDGLEARDLRAGICRGFEPASTHHFTHKGRALTATTPMALWVILQKRGI